MAVKKAYGVYHADGGIIGELAYVWGKIKALPLPCVTSLTGEYLLRKNGGNDIRLGFRNRASAPQ